MSGLAANTEAEAHTFFHNTARRAGEFPGPPFFVPAGSGNFPVATSFLSFPARAFCSSLGHIGPCGCPLHLVDSHLVPCVKAGVAASFRPVAPVPDSALLSANAFFFNMQNRFLKYFIEWRKTTSEKKYEVTGSGATPPGERYFLRATAIGEVDG